MIAYNSILILSSNFRFGNTPTRFLNSSDLVIQEYPDENNVIDSYRIWKNRFGNQGENYYIKKSLVDSYCLNSHLVIKLQ